MAGGQARTGGGGPRARPGSARRRPARRPRTARAADPRLPGRGRVARADVRLAAPGGLPPLPGRHPRQRRLRRRRRRAAGAAARARGRRAGSARDRDRPEPWRQLRQGAGCPPARPGLRARHARLAARGAAGGPPARAAARRGREPPRLAGGAGAVQALLPPGRVLRLVLGGPGRAVPRGRRVRVDLLAQRRDRRLARLPRPRRRQLVEISSSHIGMAVSPAAWRAVAKALERFRRAEARRRPAARQRPARKLRSVA